MKRISILYFLESLVRVVDCVDISTQCQLAHKMRGMFWIDIHLRFLQNKYRALCLQIQHAAIIRFVYFIYINVLEFWQNEYLRQCYRQNHIDIYLWINLSITKRVKQIYMIGQGVAVW